MRSRYVLALLAAVTLVAGLGAGCGSSSAPTVDEFAEVVVTTRNRVEFALARIPKATSKAEYLNRIEEAGEAIGDAAGDLGDIEAPDGFEEEHEKLVRGLHQLSVDLEATASDARQPGFGELVLGAEGLSFESWDQVNLALAGMAGKGIDVSVLQPAAS